MWNTDSTAKKTEVGVRPSHAGFGGRLTGSPDMISSRTISIAIMIKFNPFPYRVCHIYFFFFIFGKNIYGKVNQLT
jgi:hypothetical protein